jgi:uncharacterized membrane protein YkvA (DUF1232 family)
MSKFTPSSELNETAGFLGGLVKQSRLAWRLLRDGRVPGWVKMIPFAGLLYFLSPIDLIPDMAIPGLGEIDDVVVLVLALKMFVDLSPASIVREHIEDLFGMSRNARQPTEPSTPATIEGSYRVLDAPNSERRTQNG